MSSDSAFGAVLVVDDNAENRVLAKAALEDEDVPVVVAATGGAAISARAAPGGVELRVADRGPGVAADQRDRVFERFVSGGSEAPRTNRGLGLAFCKVAVEAHGGQIWVEDGASGAVFCVRIPDAT